MRKNSLLLVDSDSKSRRVLEVSLKKAGFNVTTADNGRDALGKITTVLPDLVISGTEMPGMNGFEFCAQLKNDASWRGLPFLFLSDEGGIEIKIRGLELGVEDYLTKPVYVQELVTRVRLLLDKKQRESLRFDDEGEAKFSGGLGVMSVVDLIQNTEQRKKTGVILFQGLRRQSAALFFRAGKIIDAECGHLQGKAAVYRLLTWNEGDFEVVFRAVRRRDAIADPTQAVLMEGMRRLDEWGRLLEQLPALDAVYSVDHEELISRLADLPDEVNILLRLFDGERSLWDIIDRSGIPDLVCLEAISKLYFEGILLEEQDLATASREWSEQSTAPYVKLSASEAARRARELMAPAEAAQERSAGRRPGSQPLVDDEERSPFPRATPSNDALAAAIERAGDENAVIISAELPVAPVSGRTPRRKAVSTEPIRGAAEAKGRAAKRRRPMAPTRPYSDRAWADELQSADGAAAESLGAGVLSAKTECEDGFQLIERARALAASKEPPIADDFEAVAEWKRDQRTPVIYPAPVAEAQQVSGERAPEQPSGAASREFALAAGSHPGAAEPAAVESAEITPAEPIKLARQRSMNRPATVMAAVAEPEAEKTPVAASPDELDEEYAQEVAITVLPGRPRDAPSGGDDEEVRVAISGELQERGPRTASVPPPLKQSRQLITIEPGAHRSAIIKPIPPGEVEARRNRITEEELDPPAGSRPPPPVSVVTPAPASPPFLKDIVVPRAVRESATGARVPDERHAGGQPPLRRAQLAKRSGQTARMKPLPMPGSGRRSTTALWMAVGASLPLLALVWFFVRGDAHRPQHAVVVPRARAVEPVAAHTSYETPPAPPPERPHVPAASPEQTIASAQQLAAEGHTRAAAERLASVAGDAHALELRAELWYQLEERSLALASADAALEIEPARAGAWLTKALAHKDLGQRSRARAAFESYLALRPKARNAVSIRRILSSL